MSAVERDFNEFNDCIFSKFRTKNKTENKFSGQWLFLVTVSCHSQILFKIPEFLPPFLSSLTQKEYFVNLLIKS